MEHLLFQRYNSEMLSFSKSNQYDALFFLKANSTTLSFSKSLSVAGSITLLVEPGGANAAL